MNNCIRGKSVKEELKYRDNKILTVTQHTCDLGNLRKWRWPGWSGQEKEEKRKSGGNHGSRPPP